MKAYTRKEYKHHKSRFDSDLGRHLPHCVPDPHQQLTDEQKDKLVCKLCGGYSYRAVQVPCCHSIFCKRCLGAWFDTGRGTAYRSLYHHCPVCGKKLQRCVRRNLRTDHRLAKMAATAASLTPARAALVTPLCAGGRIADDAGARALAGLPTLSPFSQELPPHLRALGRELRSLEPPPADALEAPPAVHPVDTLAYTPPVRTQILCPDSARLAARAPAPLPTAAPAPELQPLPSPCRRAAASGLSAPPTPGPSKEALLDPPPIEGPVVSQIAEISDGSEFLAPHLLPSKQAARQLEHTPRALGVAMAVSTGGSDVRSDSAIRARRFGLWLGLVPTWIGVALMCIATCLCPPLCIELVSELWNGCPGDENEDVGPLQAYMNELFHPTDDQLPSDARAARARARADAANENAAALEAAVEAAAVEREAELAGMIAAVQEQMEGGEVIANDVTNDSDVRDEVAAETILLDDPEPLIQ